MDDQELKAIREMANRQETGPFMWQNHRDEILALLDYIDRLKEKLVEERALAIHARQHDNCDFTEPDHRRAYYFVAQTEIEKEDAK